MLKISAVLSILATTTVAMTIVGVGSGPNGSGTLYEINPVTGAAATIGEGNNWIPMSASGTAGAYFATSLVNPYLVSYPSLSWILTCTYCPYQSTPWMLTDTAYDFATGTLYGIVTGTGQGGGVSMLARLGVGEPQSYGGGSFRPLSGSPLFPLSGTIEAIPGVGILVTGGSSAYILDPNTGVFLRGGLFHLADGFPFAFLPPVTSLAYDPDTGRLIGATGNYFDGQAPGMIYGIDPNTFEVTVLNATAPKIHGLAAINNYPEPATMLLVGTALVALWRFRKD